MENEALAGDRRDAAAGGEGMRRRVQAFIERTGRRPRALMSRPGEKHLETAAGRLANHLADMGFDVDLSPPLQKPEEAARMALENDVHAICRSNARVEDAELVGAVRGEALVVGLADAASAGDAELADAGFDAVFSWESSAADVASFLMDRLETVDATMDATMDATDRPAADYINGVLAGDRRVIAKTLTLIESRKPAHRDVARQVLDALYPKAGGAARVGITGVPGAGKSTLIESFGMRLLEKGHRVAVFAIDPSSAISGGSLLGDKTRMPRLSFDARAFVRPTPSSGMLGGVAGRTREAMMVCEAAGFDVILVETVGVGQSEIAVAGMVDFFLLLLVAGAGDQFQGIKKGIIEMADAIAITKADGDNVENARAARDDYAAALHLLRPERAYWSPPVVTTSVYDMESLDAIWEIIQSCVGLLKEHNELDRKRGGQAIDWMLTMVEQRMLERFRDDPAVNGLLDGLRREVADGRVSPELAARRLLSAHWSEMAP